MNLESGKTYQINGVALNTDTIPMSATPTNKYYSPTLFNTDLATKTTDNLTQGTTNKYYSSALAQADAKQQYQPQTQQKSILLIPVEI